MDYETLKPYIKKGLISERPHPEDPNVRIYNYTPECQFSGAWDDVTRQCRGLILNVETGEVLARPFPKFFNYQEYIAKGWELPKGKPIITEKLDGSLGILYWLNGKPWIATRGSFTSEQAIWATDWWRKNCGEFLGDNLVTRLFEIIYPENRIVVNYDYSGLVHITSLSTETGGMLADFVPTPNAEEFGNLTLEELLTMDKQNEEGFVLYYPESNVRMKVKFPEYVRLHRIVTGVNEIAIWEMLRDNKPMGELLEKVPDEFFNWVTKTQAELLKAYAEIETICKNDFLAINHAGRSRKEIAFEFQECKHPGILFAMLDGKDYSKEIWKLVRPNGSKVFKTDIDI